MRRTSIFSIWVVGFSALVAQMLLIRELTTVFYGNELFVGWILFSWLIGGSSFSFLFGRITPHHAKAGGATGLAHSFLALLLPFLIIAARWSRTWVGLSMALPDLPRSMWLAFCLILPLTGTITAIFLSAVKSTSHEDRSSSWGSLLGTAYMHETLGFVCGGLMYGYILALVDTFRVAAIIQWLNVLAAGVWYASPLHRSLRNKLFLALAAATATFVTAAGSDISRRSLKCLFPEQQIVTHQQSIYGPYAVTRLGAQYNFYQGGALIGSDENTEWNEQFIHLALLCHPAPQRILLVGGGLTGALSEILKHHPVSVDYVELNPSLVNTVRTFLPEPIAKTFADARVRLIAEDGRGYLNRASAQVDTPRYNAILISMADPTSLLLNRYYTVECMDKVRNLLAPGGIFATHLSFSPDFVSADQVRMAATVYRAMQTIFQSILVLPEYSIFLIASPDTSLAYDAQLFLQRWAERDLRTSFVSPPFLEYRLTTDRNQQVLDLLEQSNETPNRDTYPRAMFLSMVRWLQLLHPRMAGMINRMGASRAHSYGCIVAGVVLLLAILFKRRSVGDKMISMSVISFTVMATETTLLLLFQVVYGYFYYRMSLVIAAVMLGMATGSWIGTRWSVRSRRGLALVHAGFVLLSVVLFGLVWKSAVLVGRHAAALQLFLVFLAWSIGLLGGLEFTQANKLLFSKLNDHRRTGWIYGADLLGSSAGALLTSLWLLPVLGWLPSLIILAMLNAVAALTLYARPC